MFQLGHSFHRFMASSGRTSAGKRKADVQKPPATTCKFLNVDITGSAASVKLELYQNGSRIFTDYLSLYKFPDGWKIMSKTYYRHA